MDTSLTLTTNSFLSEQKGPSRWGLCRTFFYRSPEDEEHQTRGKLYALICVSGREPGLDLELLVKQAGDTLTEEYYHQLEGGIAQALNRSVEKTQEKISLLVHKEDNSSGQVDFALAVGVVWGKIVYFNVGPGVKAVILREGEVNLFPFTTSSPERIRNKDQIILCTDAFWEELGEDNFKDIAANFPTEEWEGELQKFFQANESESSRGAYFINVEEEEVPGEEEVFDLGVVEEVVRADPLGQKTVRKISSWTRKLAGFLPQTKKIFLKDGSEARIFRRKAMSLVLIALLLVSVVSTYGIRRYLGQQRKEKEVIEQAQSLLEEGRELVSTQPQLAAASFQEAVNLLKELPSGDEAQTLGQQLEEALQGSYGIVKVTAKAADDWPEAAKERLLTLTSDGVSFWDGVKIELAAQSDWQNIVALDSFTVNSCPSIYLLDAQANQIHKYVCLSPGYSRRFDYFRESVDLGSAVDLSIEGNVFVLYQDGRVEKYLGGEKQEFRLSGFYPSLEGARKIFTAPEMDYLYLAKGGRIFVFGNEGEYQKLWEVDGVDKINNLFVNSEESKLWFGTEEEPKTIRL